MRAAPWRIAPRIYKRSWHPLPFVLFVTVMQLPLSTQVFVVDSVGELRTRLAHETDHTELSLPAGATFHLGGDALNITGSVVIYGNGATLDAHHRSRIFEVTGRLTLLNMTLSRGFAPTGGCILAVAGGLADLYSYDSNSNSDGQSSLALQNVTLADCWASESGGGVHAVRCTITMESCTVARCKVKEVDDCRNISISTHERARGGFLHVERGSTLIQGSSIHDCHAISVCTAGGVGGAIYVAATQLTINNSSIHDTSAQGSSSAGGAIYAYGNAKLVVQHTSISDTSVLGTDPSSGFLYADNSEVQILSSTIDNTMAKGDSPIGGAIEFDGGHLTIRNCTLNGTAANGWGARGGALAIYGGVTLIDDVRFIATAATTKACRGSCSPGDNVWGGGVYIKGGELTMTRSSMWLAAARGAFPAGGGLAVFGGTANMSTVDLVGTMAEGKSAWGGAIAIHNDGKLFMSDATVRDTVARSIAGTGGTGGVIGANGTGGSGGVELRGDAIVDLRRTSIVDTAGGGALHLCAVAPCSARLTTATLRLASSLLGACPMIRGDVTNALLRNLSMELPNDCMHPIAGVEGYTYPLTCNEDPIPSWLVDICGLDAVCVQSEPSPISTPMCTCTGTSYPYGDDPLAPYGGVLRDTSLSAPQGCIKPLWANLKHEATDAVVNLKKTSVAGHKVVNLTLAVVLLGLCISAHALYIYTYRPAHPQLAVRTPSHLCLCLPACYSLTTNAPPFADTGRHGLALGECRSVVCVVGERNAQKLGHATCSQRQHHRAEHSWYI